MAQELASVKNALLILKCFTSEKSKLKVTEISQMTGLAKSTVSRNLQTLAQEGFVRKANDKTSYLLGLTILNLAGVVLSSMRITQELSPGISSLVYQTNESAHIAILDGMEIVYLQKEESALHTKMKTHLGRRNPAHATSSGKLLLAYKEPAFWETYADKKLIAYTPATITNPLKLKQELQQIKKVGFAYSKDELTTGISSLAVPVRDYTRTVIASIALVGSSKRFTKQHISELMPILIKASKTASENLGYWK